MFWELKRSISCHTYNLFVKINILSVTSTFLPAFKIHPDPVLMPISTYLKAFHFDSSRKLQIPPNILVSTDAVSFVRNSLHFFVNLSNSFLLFLHLSTAILPFFVISLLITLSRINYCTSSLVSLKHNKYNFTVSLI